MFLLYYGRLQTRKYSTLVLNRFSWGASTSLLAGETSPFHSSLTRLIRTCSRNNNSDKPGNDDGSKNKGKAESQNRQKDEQAEKRRKRIEKLGLSAFKFVPTKAPEITRKTVVPLSPAKKSTDKSTSKVPEPVFKEKTEGSSQESSKKTIATKMTFGPEVTKKLAMLIDSQDPEKVAKILENEPMKRTELFQAKINQDLEKRVKQAQERQSSQRESELAEAADAEKEKLRLDALKQQELTSKLVNEVKNSLKKEGLTRERTRIGKALKTPYKPTEDVREDSLYNQAHFLESGNGLLFFDKAALETPPTESFVWSEYYKKTFEQEKKLPYRNAYEEMIELTNDGKLWHFPINNEQGIDESEASVPFFEHIFLDHHLEEFPDIEPIQEFMTLVLNGLSKNSHISVDEKNEIIKWYKDYFNEKLDIIKEAQELERMEREGIAAPKTKTTSKPPNKDQKPSEKKKEVKKN